MNRISARAAVAAIGVPLVVAAAAAVWIGWSPSRSATHTAAQVTRGARARLANLAVPFIANRGQLDRQVAFYAPTFAGTAFITHTGSLVLSLPPQSGQKFTAGWTLVESPVTNRTPSIRGVQPTKTRVAVFQGSNKAHWQHGLQTYAQVSLGEVWPGVDYGVRAHGANVERLFTIQAGADAGAIRMRVRGAHALQVEHGRLVAETGNGPVTLSRPRAWQRVDGKRHTVPVQFTVAANEYGFRLGAHDRQAPVVIDPLIRTTYLGGANGISAANAMQILTANGNVYLVGATTSAAFPGTVGGAQPVLAGANDAFVAELSPDLSQLIQTTYLGGSGDDAANALAIAPAGTPNAGDIYIAGTTHSTDFPGTTGGAQAQCGGSASACQTDGDGFVAVLAPDLKTLIQASYLGGSDTDEATALAIAPSSATSAGAVYVAGRTLSQDFPHVAGGAQPQAASADFDGFVARFNPGLTAITQASYLGGTAVDEIYALALAPAPATSGTVYVAGNTSSSDFPCANAGGPPPAGGACAAGATSGAQSQLAGSFDAFVSAFDSTLTHLKQSTYLGGSDVDNADVLAVAPAGNSEAGQVFVGGDTYSTDFPGVANGAQKTSDGNGDGFVARLTPDLHSLGGASYLGGSGTDNVQALVFDGTSALYAAGQTASTDFPCTAPGGPAPAGGGKCTQQHAGAQSNYGGGLSDGFVALLDTTLGSLVQATYQGGNNPDSITGIGMAPAASTFAGDVVVGGATYSANLAGTTGAAQPAYTGSGDAFAAAIAPNLQGPQITLNVAVNGPASVDAGNNFTMTVVVTNDSPSGSTAATNVSVADTISSPTSTATVTYVSSQTTQGTCTNDSGFLTCNLGNLTAGGGSATITITATAGGAAGDSTSNVTVTADQALSSGSTNSVSHDTNITKPSSSGGGAFGWPSLLLLTAFALGLAIRRQRELAQARV
ncbi:MAG: hypothetical protein ACRETC_02680 [Gammaproteobacteria bacterium]